eukprot:TRINITY_DN15933_c0_g1_i1.p1 TRINITY_DN15933_c0_g1~~TRINITY_DN15933_c0_g1_i1.p1  ORF type:complete len:159 (+),score=28.07 TRINITY_DN15933_c0_g1_i1:82-558(+)
MIQKVWVNNVPCDKNLTELCLFYNDYDRLKNFIFNIFNNTGVLNEIEKNKKILLKPNWVYHNINESDEICLTTHPNFILAVLEFVLQLKPASIIIGDSPIQSCKWDSLHSPDFKDKVKKLQEINNICLLYTSDAADDMQCVDLGGCRIIKKKKKKEKS